MTEPKIQTLVDISPKERARLQAVEQKARTLIQYFARYGEVTHEQIDELREEIGMTREEARGEQ